MAAKSISRDAEDGRNESGQDVSGARGMDGSDEDVQNKHNESGASDDGVDAEDNSIGSANKKAHNKPANVWDRGTPKVKVTRNKPYEKPEAVFKDIKSPTREEIIKFDRNRSFFMLKKDCNINGIITRASFEQVNNSEEFRRLKPLGGWKILNSLPDIHMAYIGVADDVPDEEAQMLMEMFAKFISLPHNSPSLFQAVDIEGQINTSSRNHIETVVYFSHKPNLDDLIKVIIKLVKNNEKLLSILGCVNHEIVRSQMQLTNCEGVSKASIINAVSSQECHVSNVILMPLFHIAERVQQNDLFTSGHIRLTISHPKGVEIPTSFKAQTLSGGCKLIHVKQIFQYDKHLKTPVVSNSMPDTSPESHPLYRTKMCKQLPQCLYKDKCWFAHEKDHLRNKPTQSRPTDNES